MLWRIHSGEVKLRLAPPKPGVLAATNLLLLAEIAEFNRERGRAEPLYGLSDLNKNNDSSHPA
jgi:hypothetical protein